MDKNGGNGNNGLPPPLSNPGKITTELCFSFRSHLNTKINNLDEKIDDVNKSLANTIKLSVSIVGFMLAVLQLILHYSV